MPTDPDDADAARARVRAADDVDRHDYTCALCQAPLRVRTGQTLRIGEGLLPGHYSPADAAVRAREAAQNIPLDLRAYVRTCDGSHHWTGDVEAIARDRLERSKPGRYVAGHP